MTVNVNGDGYVDVVGMAQVNYSTWLDTRNGLLDLNIRCKTEMEEYNVNLGMNATGLVDPIVGLQIDELRIGSAYMRQNRIDAKFSDPLPIGRLSVRQTKKNAFEVQVPYTEESYQEYL